MDQTGKQVVVGCKVQWSNGRKPLGVVVHIFPHRGTKYAIIEDARWGLKVVRIYEKMLVVE